MDVWVLLTTVRTVLPKMFLSFQYSRIEPPPQLQCGMNIRSTMV
jgi:hypothetical protein